ncbi:Zinc knuckle CX2CX4HX4C [Trema orientale]|uniref:Zinc knuckle CX2CX4HX4C n=1 Tax=Trema orientale TaxID=63057 RepID=A0A2P5FKH0_TREOI|nr:Zinc knuckle CX2CX4HX4C [Trema orientale]
MDPEEVAKLCERLNLDDYKGPKMRMSPTMYQDGKEKMDLYLVGRVFGNKIVNREVNQIVSVFYLVVLGISRNQLISLLKPQGVGLVSSMNFTKVPFWVQFHNVPIVCRSDRCTRLWGELISHVIDVDSDGPNLRARIVIDVTKLLCRGLRVFPDEDSDSISIPMQFEYLQEFYFRCGIIGHKLRECSEEEPVDQFGKPVPNRFGDWLKAFNLKQWRKECREHKEEPVDRFGKLVPNRFGDWLKAFDLKQWRKECRERKGGGHWSDSNTSSGKSSNSSGGANRNNIDVFDWGLNSDEENTRVAVMTARERKIFGLSNIDGTSKVTEKSVSTRIDSGGEMRAEKNLLKGKNKVRASSGVASGEALYVSPDQVVDIQVTTTTNTYPIYNVEEPDIPLQALISGPESKQDAVSTRKARTWKRVSRGSPNKTKTKKKQSGGLAAPITTSPFVKNLKHISPKHNRSHTSPRGAKPDGSQPELAKPSVKRRLPSSFLELSSDEVVKRGKVVANEIQNMDVVESASPVSQDCRSS